MNFIDKLKEMDACKPAIKWAENYGTLDEAWAACERGDWMMWLIGRTCTKSSPEHIALVRLSCRIARDVLPHVPVGELRPIKAIEAAEKWCDAPTEENAAAAEAAAYAAARAAAKAALKKYAGWTREAFPNPPKIGDE